MTKVVTFDASGFEFGNAISCGLLFPYNCKRAGWTAHSCSRMSLPKEWTDLWFDGFGTSRQTDEGVILGDKKPMEKFVFEDCGITDFKPMSFPKPIRPIQEKYVVLIPTITELAKGNHHKLELCMSFDAWMNITNFLHGKGLKVVSFSSDEACPKEMSEKIGDIHFHATKRDLKPNTFLKNQLEWMSWAETSVSFGGALHIAFSFDVPGIGYDGQMIRNYINISRSYENMNRVSKFSLVTSANAVARKNDMYDYKVKPEMAKQFYMLYSDIVIEKIKEILKT